MQPPARGSNNRCVYIDQCGVRVGSKNPSLVNTVCHHSADRRDGFILTTPLPHIIHSCAYNTTIIIQVASLTLENFREKTKRIRPKLIHHTKTDIYLFMVSTHLYTVSFILYIAYIKRSKMLDIYPLYFNF